MKVVYVNQPYDWLFPPIQNSIGLIVYNTALLLARSAEITLYGKDHRGDSVPEGLPFKFRPIPVPLDEFVEKLVRKFPRAARWMRVDGKADEHWQYYSGVGRFLSDDRPDLVHVMNYWSRCRDLKSTGASGRLVLEMQCEWLSQRDRNQVARQLEVIDAVVAVSDHIANTFRAAFPKYPGIVATVGNGVDVTHFRPSAEAEGPPTRGNRTILFVGRVSPEKGIHTLIEAFGEVARKVRDVELKIAGSLGTLPPDFITSLSSDPRVTALLRFYDREGRSTYQQHLEELVARHGIGDRVHFIGGVPHKDLVATYQSADVVVNPSLSESFGISVVEGMACGVPVVGTRIGGMCETILDGVTGLLVESDSPDQLAQALISVLEDPSRARRMGSEGRKRATEQYSWTARGERLMAVYQKLLAQR